MPKPPIEQQMNTLLSKRNTSSALRKLTTAPPTSIDFSSNDFLSLSRSPLLKEAYLQELHSHHNFSLGSGGSRLLDGNSTYAEELEKSIAEFHKAPAALLFNSGFDANAGFFACVPQPGDVILYDEFIHASVHEGMRLSRAGARISFSHNSVEDLRGKIEILLSTDEAISAGKKNVFVAVESLYSMDGDLAPIEKVVDVVEGLLPWGNGLLIVDEAHSSGIYGDQGRGVVCSLGIEDRIFARLHTFGKALACNGAAMLCSPLTREYLINYARPLIYTTSMSFPSLAAIKVAYSLMRNGVTEPLISHLNGLIQYLYNQLSVSTRNTEYSGRSTRVLELPKEPPQSPIISLLTPEPRSLARYCQSSGLVVRPIVPPTVPEGTQRVRVCLHAGNTYQDVDKLVQIIGMWLRMEDQSYVRNAGREEFLKAVL